jgi:hypothetical protein
MKEKTTRFRVYRYSVSTTARAIRFSSALVFTGCAAHTDGMLPARDRDPRPGLATPDAAAIPQTGAASDAATVQSVGSPDAAGSQAVSSSDDRCPITESFAATLSDDCVVDLSLRDMPCLVEGASCVRFEDVPGPDSLRSVCSATCSQGPRLAWSVGCTTGCRHACAEPTPDTPRYELDIRDCEQRAVVACPSGSVTVQDQLDNLLRSLVSDANVSLQEVHEDSLVVHFEGGCPHSFHAKSLLRQLVTLKPELRKPLAGLRWDCAEKLGCGEVHGPSAITAQ